MIQIINNEVICSASSNLPSENNAHVLVHCRVEGNGKLAFTFKTASMAELGALENVHLPALSQGAPSNQLQGLF